MTETKTATEEKNGDENNENSNSGSKRGNKTMGGINGYVSKDKEGNDFNNIKCKYMYILFIFPK